jgi:hypothetical protein
MAGHDQTALRLRAARVLDRRQRLRPPRPEVRRPPPGPLAEPDPRPRQLAQQAEIYHSILQRKLLDPNDFPDTATLARALNDFERHYNQIAQPFDWNFTRADLAALLDRLDQPPEAPVIPLAA